MHAAVKVDRSGRLVLPKPVRRQLQLDTGDSLDLESFDDNIVLRPVRVKAIAFKKQGIWVFRTGAALKSSVVDATIRSVRVGREGQALRKKR